jgi:hypothetical protein
MFLIETMKLFRQMADANIYHIVLVDNAFLTMWYESYEI